jgi:hypothetical protein
MKQSGIYLSTSESIIFQLMKTANYEKFKEISKLCNPKITGPKPDPGL